MAVFVNTQYKIILLEGVTNVAFPSLLKWSRKYIHSNTIHHVSPTEGAMSIAFPSTSPYFFLEVATNVAFPSLVHLLSLFVFLFHVRLRWEWFVGKCWLVHGANYTHCTE